MSVIDRLRQPEYTGNNRCTPCTAVNVVIAASVSVLAAFVSVFIGAGVFTLSLATIYLRGYLIPGTPSLTKRYFPKRVLQWFDKNPTTPMADESIEINPEQVLFNLGVVSPCRKDTDLCLTSEFQQMWRERIHTVRENDLNEDDLMSALGVSPGDDRVTIDQHGDAFIAHTGDTVVGQWSSQAAIVADVAASSTLNERFSDWSEFSAPEIARVLMSLRIFIEQCPECDGSVRVDEKVVESCCRSYDVVASVCQNCGARLFEIEWDNAGTDDSPKQSNQSTQTSA